MATVAAQWRPLRTNGDRCSEKSDRYVAFAVTERSPLSASGRH
jgi:hypothetical protein